MAGTRTSPRFNRTQKTKEPTDTNDKKRKAADDTDSSPAKPAKKQQTLEQNGVKSEKTKEPDHDQDMKDVAAEAEAEEKANGTSNGESNGNTNGHSKETNSEKVDKAFSGKTADGDDRSQPEHALKESRGSGGLNDASERDAAKDSEKNRIPHDDVHAAQGTAPERNHQDDSTSKPDDSASKPDDSASKPDDNNTSAVEKDKTRADQMPSNILERGVIYFFSRGRVGVDNMESVQDIQRSFFVLRPLPSGTKLTSGTLTDSDLKPTTSNRLLALPKKVWPKSGADKFMAFVEKAPTSLEDLKTNFFQGSEYTTQTSGVRSQPPVTPVGEGVYAITTNGASGSASETHLSYMLTIPRQPGDLQSDIGLAAKASFVISLKNPESKGPANAQLATPAEFPKEIMDEFRGRSWMPARPEHLDYANCQILMIGVGDVDASSALAPPSGGENDQKKDEKMETPGEELEKLEEEDEKRVQGLRGDDAVFADLGLDKDEYPDVATTW